MSNSKCVYYKEKEQKSTDGGITWVDTGNFRKGGIISTQAAQCGSFVTEYKWVKADYVCDNGNKYNGYKQQVSYDNGGNWSDTGVVNIGDLIESNSRDCGYDEQWFVMTGDNDFICDGASKYKKKEMKYTRDSGTTWNSFEPQKYEKGDLIAETSSDCATLSMKVTYTDDSTKIFTGLTSIEKNTDSNKSNAKSVEIYDGVTRIGDEAFWFGRNLTVITLSDSVTSIGKRAFYDCEKLTGITIPSNVTSIGDSAFYGCSSLTDIVIPNSVTSIGTYAFQSCTSLTNVKLSDGLTSIGEQAFYNCEKLTGITIPSNVTSIGDSAFFSCSSLSSITVPNSVTEIGKQAFEGCSSLALVTIGNGLTKIGNGAFYFCYKFTTMTIYATTPPALGGIPIRDIIPNTISIIYVPAESVDTYKSADGWKDYSSAIFAIGTIPTPSMKVTDVNNSEKTYYNLTGIKYNTLVTSRSNVKEVEIYDGVEAIGSNSFYNCTGLTSITIANSVTYIGWSAFQNCLSLTDIIIPNSVTEIGNGAFKGCSGLTEMTVKASTPPRLGDNEIPSNVSTIYVPAASVNSYKSADGWKDYVDKIQAIPE